MRDTSYFCNDQGTSVRSGLEIMSMSDVLLRLIISKFAARLLKDNGHNGDWYSEIGEHTDLMSTLEGEIPFNRCYAYLRSIKSRL
jgi:hypothetical protein